MAASGSTPIARSVLEEQVAMFYHFNRYGWAGLLILWAALLAAYWPALEAGEALLYSLLVGLGSGLYFLNQYRYERRPEGDSPRRWVVTGVVLSAGNGLILGLSPLFLLDLDDLAMVYVVSALVVLPLFGSAVVSGSIPAVHAAWVICYTEPLALLFLLEGDYGMRIIGATMQFVALPLSLVLNLFIHRIFTTTIELRFEKQELIERLAREKAAAEQANRDKSHFLAAASHDLRQPLYALELFLAALLEKLQRPDEVALALKAQASSRNLEELLNASLDISRMEAGLVSVRRRPVELATLVRPVVSELREQAREKGIVIETALPETLVDTDPVLLARMVRNLLCNAIRHNARCRVEVVARDREEAVELIVRDHGRGIDAADQERIFGEFFQSGSRSGGPGVGLGLAIVKRLALLLDLELKLESAPGRGTAFTLRLRRGDGQGSALQPAAAPRRRDLAGLFVLLVEDDALVRQAARALLRSWNCEVLGAASAEEALESLRGEGHPRPDLILSDYHLPGGRTGPELVDAVSRLYGGRVPAIVVSGDLSPRVVEKVAARGHPLLPKPVDNERLRSEIEALLPT